MYRSVSSIENRADCACGKTGPSRRVRPPKYICQLSPSEANVHHTPSCHNALILGLQNEWEVFTGQLGSVAGVSEAGRPRGFPPWASPDREEAFALLAEYLPHLVQAADLADAERSVWSLRVSSFPANVPTYRTLDRLVLLYVGLPQRKGSGWSGFCIGSQRLS